MLVTPFLRRYGLYVACGTAVVAAIVAYAVHVAREPPSPLAAKWSAPLTVCSASSAEGARLIEPLGGVGTARFALVKLTWTSKGNACDLDAVMHPDLGWTLATIAGDGERNVSAHDWSSIVAHNPDAVLFAEVDTPVALSKMAGTLTLLYALSDNAVARAPAARVWLVDRCGKTKPERVAMPRTLVGLRQS